VAKRKREREGEKIERVVEAVNEKGIFASASFSLLG